MYAARLPNAATSELLDDPSVDSFAHTRVVEGILVSAGHITAERDAVTDSSCRRTVH